LPPHRSLVARGAALRVWAGVAVGATGAFISPVAGSYGVSLSLDAPQLRQGLRVTLTSPEQFQLGPGQVSVRAWLTTMLSCARLRGQSLEAALCATFDVGRLHAQSQGFSEPLPGVRSYEALGVELQGVWSPARPLRISAALGGLLPFTRESFSVNGLGPAYVPPQVGWRALLLSELAVF
jgi:hypothetical protein